MALFGKLEPDYTKTGKGGLTQAANIISFIPIVSDLGKFFTKIPFIGNTFGALLGYIDTAWEAGKWAFKGKFGSAATVLATGVVSNTVNAIPGPAAWVINAGSGVATGASIGTHARKVTESVIAGIGSSFGNVPEVLNPNGQYKFRDGVAAERGMSRDQLLASKGDGGAYVNQTQTQLGVGA